jgi:hypothetical protein
LRAPCPQPVSPATLWSADLTLRWLPDLWQLAAGIAREDPLVVELQRLAAAWPLGSVGVPLTSPPNVAHLALLRTDASLGALYLDRVLAAGDAERMREPWLLERARSAVGAHPHLAGRLQQAIFDVQVAALAASSGSGARDG